MKQKWREKSAEKKRDCSSLAALFWYLPQIQVSRDSKEQEEAVEMYVEKKKKRTKRKTKKRRSAGAEPGKIESKSVSDN